MMGPIFIQYFWYQSVSIFLIPWQDCLIWIWWVLIGGAPAMLLEKIDTLGFPPPPGVLWVLFLIFLCSLWAPTLCLYFKKCHYKPMSFFVQEFVEKDINLGIWALPSLFERVYSHSYNSGTTFSTWDVINYLSTWIIDPFGQILKPNNWGILLWVNFHLHPNGRVDNG